MKLSGWGRYPVIESESLAYADMTNLGALIQMHQPLIAYGNGRSYGDCALSRKHIPMQSLNRLLSFDESSGLLICEAGVLLSDIIKIFLPKGWFLKVSPGTKLITVGGAVASDVHGKNHHIAGCFSECIENFDLLIPDGSILTCSKNENTDWFHATCGGMGLTGIIVRVGFYLKRVNSQSINQTIIKTQDLTETFKAFEENAHHTYSVAWIDCLAKQEHIGRSLLMLGEFADDNDLNYQPKQELNIPINFPSYALNQYTVRLFNCLYYARIRQKTVLKKVGLDTFFYPLDAIKNWNRIYGCNGFIQYQFILPKAHSFEGLTAILNKISVSGMGSFLAVLKLYGRANDNWLSFPIEGYSLALDFKMQPKLLSFIDELGIVVTKYQGKVYLAKDASVKKEMFDLEYPKANQFRHFRQKHSLDKHFNSLQSTRLGL